MQDYSIFPVINASLNGTAAVLIGTGVYLIKTGRERAHKAVMVLAISTSTLFLISYLYYHAHIGSYHFRGHGWARPLYFTILTTHTILAAVIVPLGHHHVSLALGADATTAIAQSPAGPTRSGCTSPSPA